MDTRGSARVLAPILQRLRGVGWLAGCPRLRVRRLGARNSAHACCMAAVSHHLPAAGIYEVGSLPLLICRCAAPIAGLPQRARQQLHAARVVVPARLAGLLRREPQLLAPAVEAFHYRDIDDMKVSHGLAVLCSPLPWAVAQPGQSTYLAGSIAARRPCRRAGCICSRCLSYPCPARPAAPPPLSPRPATQAAARLALLPPQDMVALRATFTRCLYAQLAMQEFHPLRSYPMPLPSEKMVRGSRAGQWGSWR